MFYIFLVMMSQHVIIYHRLYEKGSFANHGVHGVLIWVEPNSLCVIVSSVVLLCFVAPLEIWQLQYFKLRYSVQSLQSCIHSQDITCIYSNACLNLDE